MKKYEYVRLLYEGIVASKLSEHREVIDRYAAEGWRYVGYIPVQESPDGMTCAIDLIFEKDAQDAL